MLYTAFPVVFNSDIFNPHDSFVEFLRSPFRGEVPVSNAALIPALKCGVFSRRVLINANSLKYRNLVSWFICGDAHDPPFKSGSEDVVLAFELVEHLNDPEKSFEEIKRILKKEAFYS